VTDEHSTDNREFTDYQRILSLTDEILGLRAALAQEGVRLSPSRQKVDQLEDEIRQLRASTTWRVGRVIMLPFWLGRKLLMRLDGR